MMVAGSECAGTNSNVRRASPRRYPQVSAHLKRVLGKPPSREEG